MSTTADTSAGHSQSRLHASDRRPAAGSRRHQVKLSILMPAYNEQHTVVKAIESVLATPLPCDFELIVVNDGSTDRTAEMLAGVAHEKVRLVEHPRNFGKGAALLTGARVATGTHLVPFDADLEYDPHDLIAMLGPVLSGRADVVYGVRLFGVNTRYQSYHHAMANRALTLAANLLYDAYLSDMHTCLKLVPAALMRDIDLSEAGFGLDTEITAKLLRRGHRPFEVPVSYHSRSFAHGKKISWRDGVKCLEVLLRVRLQRVAVRTELMRAPDPLDALSASLANVEAFPLAVKHGESVRSSTG